MTTGLATTNTTVATKLNKAGGTLTGDLTINTNLLLKDSTTNYVTIKANAATTAYDFILPGTAGSAGQVLKTDGAGNLSWYTVPGALSSTDSLAEGSTNLYFTNAKAVTALGPILAGYATTGALATATTNITNLTTALGTTDANVTSVTSTVGSHTTTLAAKADLTNAAQVISAQAVSATAAPSGAYDLTNKTYVDGLLATTNSNVTTVTTGLATTNTTVATKLNKTGGTLTGDLTIDTNLLLKDSTTNYVTIKANAATTAYNFILPSTAGSAGQVLKTDGAGNLSWFTVSGALSSTDGLAEGSLNLYYTDARAITALGPTLAGYATTGALSTATTNITNLTTSLATTNGNVTSVTSTVGSHTTTLGTKADLTNAAQVISAQSVSATAAPSGSYDLTNKTYVDGLLATTNSNVSTVSTGLATTNSTVATKLNLSGGTLTGPLRFQDTGTNYVGLKSPATVTSNFDFTLPATPGTNGQALTSTGSSGILAWSDVATTSTAFVGDIGGTIGANTIGAGKIVDSHISGSAAIALTKLANIGTIITTNNTAIASGDGLQTAFDKTQSQLNNKQALDATLTSLASFNTNGLMVQTAADTFTGRSIAGTTNRLSVTNGDGVAGNPTLDINSTLFPSAVIGDVGKFLQATAADTSVWTALGTAATANIGTAAGNVMGAAAVPNCTATQSLQMSASAPYTWSCVTTTDGTKLATAGGTMSGALTLDSTLKIKGGNTNYVTMTGHATTNAYTLTLPQALGAAGNILQTDASGNLSWLGLPTCTAGQVLKSDGSTFSCVSDVTSPTMTVSRAIASNSSGALVVSATTDTELGYLSGVTSAIQTQINTKEAASAIPADVRATTLTGLVSGAGSISTADTVLTAMNKLAFVNSDYISKSANQTVNGSLAINTLTGDLIVPTSPMGVTSAVNQTYVTNYALPLAGGTLTGRLNLAAGTTTLAPMVLATGTNLTTPIDGAVEFNGTNFYLTSGGTRKLINLDLLTSTNTFTNINTFSNTTDSTSVATGSVVISGGLGVAKVLNVGTKLGIGLSAGAGGTPSATLDIDGADTGATSVMHIENSAATAILNISNNGTMVFGGALSGNTTLGNTSGAATTTIQSGTGGVKIGSSGSSLTTGILTAYSGVLNITATSVISFTFTGAATTDGVFCGIITDNSVALSTTNNWRVYEAIVSATNTVKVYVSMSGSPSPIIGVKCTIIK